MDHRWSFQAMSSFQAMNHQLSKPWTTNFPSHEPPTFQTMHHDLAKPCITIFPNHASPSFQTMHHHLSKPCITIFPNHASPSFQAMGHLPKMKLYMLMLASTNCFTNWKDWVSNVNLCGLFNFVKYYIHVYCKVSIYWCISCVSSLMC